MLDIYRSLKEISAIRFYEIAYEGNIKMMDKSYCQENKYDSEDIIELNNAWIDIYDEYFTRIDEPSMRKELRGKKETLDLLLSINVIEKIIGILEFLAENSKYIPSDSFTNTSNSIASQLKRINPILRFDAKKPIKEQIEVFKNVLGGLETRYKLLHKQQRKDKITDIMDFYNKKSAIEEVFGRNIDENVNMLQFIAYEKDCKRKLANMAKNNNTKKGKSNVK